MNEAVTLERARLQLSLIDSATSYRTMMIGWARCGGYIRALADDNLIDRNTRWLLENEADQARDAWSERDKCKDVVRESSRDNKKGLPVNLSFRYISALRQLPQYSCNVDGSGPLTHAFTGVRISPIGELHGEDDTINTLAVEFSDGYKIEVHAFAFFQIALKEAAEIEISTAPENFGIRKGKQTSVQLRIAQLNEHLRDKHFLDK